MPGLLEMVQKEIARRQAADASTFAPEALNIHDDDPEYDEKVAAFQAKYPGKRCVIRRICGSRNQFVEQPDTVGYHEAYDAALVRAADRLAKLREPPK